MRAENDIPCAYQLLLNCQQDCELYGENYNFVRGYAEGLEMSESEFVDLLRADFWQLTRKEQAKLVTRKMLVLEEKGIEPDSCLQFGHSASSKTP